LSSNRSDQLTWGDEESFGEFSIGQPFDFIGNVEPSAGYWRDSVEGQYPENLEVYSN
jgi:hypothetical protein